MVGLTRNDYPCHGQMALPHRGTFAAPESRNCGRPETLRHSDQLVELDSKGGRPETLVSNDGIYEPNSKIKALPDVVHCPDASKLLECSSCSRKIQSAWYFKHPASGNLAV